MNHILTLPNILTASRFAAIPFLLYFLRAGGSTADGLLAFALFLIAVLTDLADGYIARRRKQVTVLGKLMDPLADKVLVACALIMLIPMDRAPAVVCFLIIAREIAITGLRGVAASSGIVVQASGLGKFKSVTQYIALCVLIFPDGIIPFSQLHQVGRIFLYVSLAFTLISGVDYFVRLKKVFLTPAKS